MPVDLQLGKLVFYGFMFGLGFEVCVLAAALSQPKTLFRIASALIHKNPAELNDICRVSLFGAAALDDGAYSDAIMCLNAYIRYEKLSVQYQRDGWMWKHGIVKDRFLQFVRSAGHIYESCRTFLHDASNNKLPPRLEPLGDWQLNMLRLLLVWSCDNNLMVMKPMHAMAVNEIKVVSSELTKVSETTQSISQSMGT